MASLKNFSISIQLWEKEHCQIVRNDEKIEFGNGSPEKLGKKCKKGVDAVRKAHKMPSDFVTMYGLF